MVVLGPSVIEFAGHEHRLYLCDHRTILPVPCSWCGTRSNNPPNFRCAECLYKLDLLCGPLPVVNQTHQNGYNLTMNLVDSLVPGDNPEDCWCDICEKERDPEQCVYQSADPPFIATVDCLWPQIKLALEGGLGKVELRTVRQGHIPGKVITERDLEEKEEHQQESSKQGKAVKVTEDVETTWTSEEILKLLRDDERKLIESMEGKQSDCEESEDEGKTEASASAAIHTEEAFKQFKEQLDVASPVDTSVLFDEWRELKFSKLGDGVIIPSDHTSLYRELVDRYGDFSGNSRLTPWGKAAFFAIFFNVINRMRKIRVFESARYSHHIPEWRNTLKIMRDVAGFEVQFALDNLDSKLARGCFGFTVRDFESNQKWQLQRLSKEVQEEEAKLEELRAKQAELRRLEEDEKSLLKHCETEAYRCKWKKVRELIQQH